jgi:hypothetical protein
VTYNEDCKTGNNIKDGKSMDKKVYINLRELSTLLGLGRRNAEKVMKHLLEVAKEKNYYIPDSKRDILVPVIVVEEELKIKINNIG